MGATRYRIRLLFAGVMAVVVGSCTESSPTSLRSPALSTASRPTLLKCSADVTQSDSKSITNLGGTVSAAGSKIAVPIDAITSSAVVTLTVPASKYMEIEATVDGKEHYQFAAPVTVTIDYSRCPAGSISKPLSVWLIDRQTKALLELMPSTDDPAAKQIRFTTDHFSSYSVAE